MGSSLDSEFIDFEKDCAKMLAVVESPLTRFPGEAVFSSSSATFLLLVVGAAWLAPKTLVAAEAFTVVAGESEDSSLLETAFRPKGLTFLTEWSSADAFSSPALRFWGPAGAPIVSRTRM